jgi:hypothetical protein
MQNINYRKKMAKLRYKDLILKFSEEGKSIRDIASDINYRLSRTTLKVELSKSTIHTILKKAKNGEV